VGVKVGEAFNTNLHQTFGKRHSLRHMYKRAHFK